MSIDTELYIGASEEDGVDWNKFRDMISAFVDAGLVGDQWELYASPDLETNEYDIRYDRKPAFTGDTHDALRETLAKLQLKDDRLAVIFETFREEKIAHHEWSGIRNVTFLASPTAIEFEEPEGAPSGARTMNFFVSFPGRKGGPFEYRCTQLEVVIGEALGFLPSTYVLVDGMPMVITSDEASETDAESIDSFDKDQVKEVPAVERKDDVGAAADTLRLGGCLADKVAFTPLSDEQFHELKEVFDRFAKAVKRKRPFESHLAKLNEMLKTQVDVYDAAEKSYAEAAEKECFLRCHMLPRPEEIGKLSDDEMRCLAEKILAREIDKLTEAHYLTLIAYTLDVPGTELVEPIYRKKITDPTLLNDFVRNREGLVHKIFTCYEMEMVYDNAYY